MPAYSTQQVIDWLDGIAGGYVDLGADNMLLATSALALIGPPSTPPPPPGYLTPHFTLAEMIASDTAAALGIDNTPNEAEIAELQKTAELLERIRSTLGSCAITVTSGFRCDALNAAIGGATNSAHRYGCAADIVAPGFGSPLAICEAIEPCVPVWDVDQLIYETNDQGGVWVHVGRPNPGAGKPRGQCFSIVNGATTSSPFPDATCYSPFPGRPPLPPAKDA